MTVPERSIRADLVIQAWAPTRLALLVAVAGGAATVGEQLVVNHEVVPEPGDPIAPAQVPLDHEAVPGMLGSQAHLVSVPLGVMRATYEATVPAVTTAATAVRAGWDEQLTYLRPSRYCPSDEMAGWATAEFGRLDGDRARVEAIAAWIHDHIEYDLNATSPTGGAAGTLLSARGVCRDFAHLAITGCRALGIPARFAAVYAPGLEPMDFHAVFEAHVEGGWHVFDATRLAPRPALVRIATGRDAADTAFVTIVSGYADLTWSHVEISTTGAVEPEDPSRLVTLG